MRYRKLVTFVVGALIAGVSVLGFATPALANSTVYGFTAAMSVPPGSDFVSSQPSPAFTLTLTNPDPVTVGGTENFHVALSPKGSGANWPVSASIASTCSGTLIVTNWVVDYSALSSPADCGLTVKLNGTDIGSTTHTHAGAYKDFFGRVILYLDPTLIPGQTGTNATVTIDFAAGLYTLPASGNEFELTISADTVGNLIRNPSGFQVSSPGTISFDGMGGDGSMSASTASGPQALPSNSYTKPGYTFEGWATTIGDAARGIVTYGDGETITYTNLTLYAVWRKSTTSALANTGTTGSFIPALVAVTLVIAGIAMVFRRRRAHRR